eukprot:SAG11_NODE_1802_length_4237_cov_4.045916_1_plen_316_part_10
MRTRSRRSVGHRHTKQTNRMPKCATRDLQLELLEAVASAIVSGFEDAAPPLQTKFKVAAKPVEPQHWSSAHGRLKDHKIERMPFNTVVLSADIVRCFHVTVSHSHWHVNADLSLKYEYMKVRKGVGGELRGRALCTRSLQSEDANTIQWSNGLPWTRVVAGAEPEADEEKDPSGASAQEPPVGNDAEEPPVVNDESKAGTAQHKAATLPPPTPGKPAPPPPAPPPPPPPPPSPKGPNKELLACRTNSLRLEEKVRHTTHLVHITIHSFGRELERNSPFRGLVFLVGCWRTPGRGCGEDGFAALLRDRCAGRRASPP